MARTTTNYGFNISEGSDLVNPLTDIFPNFESLDTDLKEVSNASIGEATELKTGTVHALTRTDTNKDVFKFTATSNFTAGDTFTVDSEQVSALTTSGEQLTTGCYIIGSEVLVAKKGTLLTFYISNVITDATTLEGHSASYFATASDLADTDNDVLVLSNKVGSAILTTQAQDCSGAINELNAKLSSDYTTVETKIGKIGNDDLYRKCYFADNVNITTSQVIDAILTNSYVKMVKSINVSFYDQGDARWYNNREFNYANTFYQAIGTITNTGLNLYVTNYNISKYCIVVEYTKA